MTAASSMRPAWWWASRIRRPRSSPTTWEYVVVNPSWNVPVSIARKEMLPNLQRDPYYLQRQGITIERNGRAVDPGSVNWQAGLGGYSFASRPASAMRGAHQVHVPEPAFGLSARYALAQPVCQ